MACTFTMRLAGLVIEVTTIHDETYHLCREYRVDGGGRPDIVVTTSQSGIDFERAQDKQGCFGDPYYETLAVHRAIAEQLPLFGGLLMHGSAVAIGQRAWLFTAPSGTGKSTHTRWWRREFADLGAYMVNDDKPIIRIVRDDAWIYGAPWDGKERLSTNTCVRLAGIGMLERGDDDLVERASARDSLVTLMGQAYRPTSADAARATLGLLHRLADGVPLFRVRATDSAHAAHVAYAAMGGL